MFQGRLVLNPGPGILDIGCVATSNAGAAQTGHRVSEHDLEDLSHAWQITDSARFHRIRRERDE
jgi:hypothetical protein